MAYPDYCDERAKGLFTRGFVGTGHGDNGSAYKVMWDSTNSEAKPTKMLHSRGYPICAYCGNKGLPLQPYFAYCDSTITGYACVCSNAMDQLEIDELVLLLKQQQKLEMDRLLSRAPKVNKSVLKKLVASKADSFKKDIDRGDYSDILDAFGITIK